MNKELIVIGGGAAGFFSAINIAEKCSNVNVTILEKTNKLLSKVKVSGGGRCNVTHACFEPKELVSNYPRGEKELLGPFHHFMTGDTISWFSERGVELKMEEDGRMFPVSNSSQTIIDCFLNEAKRLGIKVATSTEAVEVSKKEKFKIKVKNGNILSADYVVFAIGGNSKEKHYELLKKLGHKIKSPIPSLFTFNLPKHSSNQLMGLAVNATVKIVGKPYEESGPLLFTHWGMSGPAVLKLSSKAAQFLYDKSYQFDYEVCWYDSPEELIHFKRETTPSQKLGNTKVDVFPNRFWHYLLERSNVNRDKNWADLSKDEMEQLASILSMDRYKANGKTTFKEEFVSCGGVLLNEINMKTMESKIVPQLYLSGEVMNVDALTGGFNFQAAWTSGFLVSDALSSIEQH